MKTVLYIFGALVTIHSAALASVPESSTQVIVSATQPTAITQLVDQKFEPVYGQEPYQDTCSRQVFSHTETRCSTTYDQVCHGGGQVCENRPTQVCNGNRCTTVNRRVCHTRPRVCNNVPRRVCSNFPVYRTEFYSCTRYRTVVTGQRLVKTFRHDIEVALENAGALGNQPITLRLNANEAQFSVQLVGSYPGHLLHQRIQELGRTDSGDMIVIRKKVIISLGMNAAIANQIFSTSVQDLQLGFELVKFKVVNAAQMAPHLKVDIKIVRNRRIGGDSILFKGSFTPAQLGLVGQGNDLMAVIPLQKLNVGALSSNRHNVEISVSLFSDSILNSADFGAAVDKKVEGKLIGAYPQNL